MANEQRANRLILENSPYLLQHAHNPVEWYSWGEEAFERARKEDKPVFLSIGYSTCHWCHVMAHESFEDSEVASLLNHSFISIKVDREERPEIDHLYMSVCTAMTGSGGWPLTIIMTPDKKPFFAGTYIPKHPRFGLNGLMNLLPKVNGLWMNHRNEVLHTSEKILASFFQKPDEKGKPELNEDILNNAFNILVKSFDNRFGGFGGAPKFPSPHTLLFLMRYWKRTGDEQAMTMVEHTLQTMRRGGIYDHIGFGFHRYSTDVQWLVPHFEKMLYDQAMLAITYTEAYLITKKEEYSRTVHEIFQYVFRMMTSPEGGFYSAEDADTEGEEGRFYLWTLEEMESILGPESCNLVKTIYGINRKGNFQDPHKNASDNKNILHMRRSISEIAKELGRTEMSILESFAEIREKMFTAREKRPHPHLDDKILTDWNGLMIAALAIAARAFDNDEFTQAAKIAVDFVLNNLSTPDGGLMHRYREGEARFEGNLDDYAFMVWGLLELYETTFHVDYLSKALQLNEFMISHFWDDENGGFYFTATYTHDLPLRKKEIFDGAIPSGNSVAMLNLLRLARITGRTDLDEKADMLSRSFSKEIERYPPAYSFFLMGREFAIGSSYEIVIAGEAGSKDTMDMVRSINHMYLPNKVLILNPTDQESPIIHSISEFVKNNESIDGRATAYICERYRCKKPITQVSEIETILDSI